MNVLQLISSEGYFGAESMMVHLCSSLETMGCTSVAGVFRNSHRPSLDVAVEARRRNVSVEIVPCNGRFDWSAIRTIRKCIQDRQISVVHTHGYKANLYGFLAARSTGIPKVATCHLWTRQTGAVRLYDYIDGFVVRQFEAVVAVSDTIATQVRSLGVERSRISTISNGTSFTDIQNGSPMLRGLEPGEIVIGTVCRLTTQKGLTYLLEAATPLLEQYPYIRFLIVGEGRDRNSLETVAKDTDISHRVTFAGLRRDIANVYASMDIFVLPSIDEGMPMALLEAMATGKAIVATNVGDVPKLIKSGETGLLIRPKEVSDLVNAISSLVKSENLRSKLGAQARAFVCETFSSERMAGQYLDLYRQLHEKGKAKSRASKTEPIGNYGA